MLFSGDVPCKAVGTRSCVRVVPNADDDERADGQYVLVRESC